jgi:hypothetical protein
MLKTLLFLCVLLSSATCSTGSAPDHFDVVVLGGTPGGIGAAVAAARLGHSVALIEYHSHLGGMTTSGLGKSDIETAGAIGGIWDEFVQRILRYYTGKYGTDSPQVTACRNGYFYEPSVAESVLNQMIAEESEIHVFLRHRLDEVVRSRNRVTAIRVRQRDSGQVLEIRGGVFIDATYEGDLAAYAGAEYRLGRESRSEFDEPHAGIIYMDHQTRAFLPGTTGEGDQLLPAYTYRLCLSSDPNNRVLLELPPDYDRTRYLNYLLDLKLGRLKSAVDALSIAPLPNQKYDANMKPWPLGFPFAGENLGYPEGTWEEREAIMAHIGNLTLGLVYFLQNDPEVPEADRERARQYGLAKDEFTDNGNFPFQFYIREARRIVGEYTLTEKDLTFAPGAFRAPVHADAVSAGEFPIDAFPTRKYEEGHETALEGYILMLKQYTQPYQIPYRVMIPKRIDGLLVPVAVSTTHIAFSSVRLEPTWMSLGQAAGVAAHLALKLGIEPRNVPLEPLQRLLISQGAVISYFNDVPKGDQNFEALQFLGTKGFFNSYEARPNEPLTHTAALEWARLVLRVAKKDIPDFHVDEKDSLLPRPSYRELRHTIADRLGVTEETPETIDSITNDTVTRGEACKMFFQLLEKTGH